MRAWLGAVMLAWAGAAGGAAADPSCDAMVGPLCATLPEDADDLREATEAAVCSFAPCPDDPQHDIGDPIFPCSPYHFIVPELCPVLGLLWIVLNILGQGLSTLREVVGPLVCPHLSDNLLPILCHWE